ncbi:MAG: HypC/HybG/HupF family hydrogenase formation chaperone [Chloroflexi bacterium]|jgi:hydrogenase expression/formation protein HypC|nr:HypC/HybG/HupF family hydrogenase formation chaperone [Chloroflexota bacterium]
MCLSIPGKITEVYEDGSLIMGKVDFGGVLKEVCLDYVPEAQTGQYVLIHVGFAISVLDEDEAMARMDLLREIESFEEELNPDEIR